MALFDAVDIIRVKRDGGALTPDQIDWTIDAYTKGVIKDEQMAALAMAIFLRGMDRGEIARWSDAMIRSGARKASHWPTMPPSESPQKWTRGMLSASRSSTTSRPRRSSEYDPGGASDPPCPRVS